MVNFGPLAAEIVSLVWSTPANFNGFRVFAALLHGTLAVGVSQTLRRWTESVAYIRQGGHNFWALAHILVHFILFIEIYRDTMTWTHSTWLQSIMLRLVDYSQRALRIPKMKCLATALHAPNSGSTTQHLLIVVLWSFMVKRNVTFS